jgi:hypothetical protein
MAIAIAALVILVLGVGAITLLGRATDTAGPADDRTCESARTLLADIAANRVEPGELRTRLDELADGTQHATDDVRVAAQRLAGSGQPGDAAFSDAAADVRRACG